MSIKLKLSIALASIILFMIAITQTAVEYQQRENHLSQLNQNIEMTSILIERQLNMQGMITDEELQQLVEIQQIAQPYLTGIYIMNTENKQVVQHSYLNMDEQLSQLIYNSVINKPGEHSTVFYNDEIHMVANIPIKNNSTNQVGVLYDKKLYEDYTTHYSTFIHVFLISAILAVLILSYCLVSYMMRPLKAIVKKVNEVTFFRFHSPISLTSSDEFGVLAFKINAMSQNLSIYMDKLRNAFNENRRMSLYLESFINHSSDAIYLLDIEGILVQANKAFEELFGYKESELLGKKLFNIPEVLLEENKNILKRLKNGEATSSVETFRYTKTGELIPVSISITSLRESNDEIIGFANVCRDMRHRHRMEELLRRSEKLTVVGQLAAGVAHEIRNPLTTLKGFLQLQQQTHQYNTSHVQVMLTELDRINFIVSEFLILAKPQAVKFKARDIRDIMDEVISFMISEAALHNIKLRTNYSDGNCVISCEENQLKQVFINVLKNAIEAMPAGGNIHIAIQKNSENIKIHVTDEGIGIDEFTLSKIGDPFFTAKENGTGLGIMVSQRIIHTHRGQMQIKSQVNVGTTIEIQLPLWQEKHYAEASSL